MSDPQALNLDEADEILVAALKFAHVVSKHFGIVPVMVACDYLERHDEDRRWLLGRLGLTNEQAFTEPSAPMNALLGGNLGSLLEIANLLKDWLPTIKTYLPQIKQLFEVAKVLFDLWKNAQPSAGDTTTINTNPTRVFDF